MVHKSFKQLKLSALGMGSMRLPLVEENNAKIDEQKTEEIIAYAMKNGINYYDTAWGYHNGNSEIVIGNILNKYPREKYYLATKFPGYDVSNMDKVEQIFEKQLEKCKVDYFDFYLFHNVCELNIEQYLDEKYKIHEYLMKQKQNGRIHYLGFSVHGSYDVMKRFLEKYGKDMEFCQIQLNYIDLSFQHADDKIELLKQYNIPIWVMEPLRGGKLCKLSGNDTKTLKQFRPEADATEWAFRFLQSIPEVTMILSGMSSLEQLKQNIQIFQTDKPLNKTEKQALFTIADGMLNGKLPCTSCHYCTTHCPQQLDIPRLLELYNEYCFTGGGFIAPMVVGTLPEQKRPSACIACKSCEAVCPQQIKISEALADFTSKLKS